MVWKQDLAQFKQQLKPDGEPSAPPPKPVQTPLSNQSLEDADLLFLRVMGGVAVPPPSTASSPSPELKGEDSSQGTVSPSSSNKVSRVLAVDESSGDFTQALGEMKGLRPLAENPVFSAPKPLVAPSPVVAIPQQLEALPQFLSPSPIAEDPAVHPVNPVADPSRTVAATHEVPHTRAGPVLMHLAAGMAIEVDGILDLRRHSLNDAKDRLKERIRDGLALRWRTLLVTLGPNEALKQGFLAFLTTPQAQFISRYAQAPIPMGGAQAWVLYLGQQRLPMPKEEA